MGEGMEEERVSVWEVDWSEDLPWDLLPEIDEAVREHDHLHSTGRFMVMESGVVRQVLPRLWEFYEGPVKARVEKLTGEQVVTGLTEWSCNVHRMRPGQDAYGRHRDFVPYTALLYVSLRKGGELVLYDNEGNEMQRITPVPGCGVVMDGKAVEHEVEPPLEADRVSVSMQLVARSLLMFEDGRV